MKTVKEAQNIILANVERLEAEDVSIMTYQQWTAMRSVTGM
jgi:hypothetical protein